jgi:endonuclease YncB( thermonuclease family)
MSDQPKYTISAGKAFLLCIVVAVVTYYATVNSNRFQAKPLADTATAAQVQPPANQEPLSLPSEEPSSPPIPDYYTVSSVIEPTTLKLTDGTNVRLIGVAAPIDELGESLEREALSFSKRLVEGKHVRLEFEPELEKDSTGHTLAYVYLEDGKLLNAEIIKKGYGSATTSYSFHLSRDFNRYELSAQNRGLGVWNVASESEFEDSDTASQPTTDHRSPITTTVTLPLPQPTIFAVPSRTYAPSTAESYPTSTSQQQEPSAPYYVPPRTVYQPPVAENGSYYGETSERTGRPKTVHVDGYTKRDGTYVREHYRSAPRRH